MRRSLMVAFVLALTHFVPISPAIANCSLQCDTTEIECSEKCCEPLPVASCYPDSPCRKKCASTWNNCVFACPDGVPKVPK